MALHHGVLPPTIKVERPNPKLELDRSPFYLNTGARPWVRGSDHPRRASVSSFGFGGTNFHVTARGVPGPGTGGAASAGDPVRAGHARCGRGRRLVELARTPPRRRRRSRLPGVARQPPAWPRRPAAAPPAGSPWSPATARTWSASSVALADHLASLARRALGHPGRRGLRVRRARAPGRAFLFPGQGSQYVGMGAELAMHFRRALAGVGPRRGPRRLRPARRCTTWCSRVRPSATRSGRRRSASSPPPSGPSPRSAPSACPCWPCFSDLGLVPVASPATASARSPPSTRRGCSTRTTSSASPAGAAS